MKAYPKNPNYFDNTTLVQRNRLIYALRETYTNENNILPILKKYYINCKVGRK